MAMRALRGDWRTWMPPGAVYLVPAGMGLLVVPLLASLSGPGAYPPGAYPPGAYPPGAYPKEARS